MEKLCVKCMQTKSIQEFAKNKSRKDGLQCYCRSCQSSYCNKYYNNNKDKIKAYNEDHKSHSLYLIFEGKSISYIGSCSYLSKRISNHINCYSNISEYMKLGTWTEIKVLDISDQVNSKQEREFIEQILIEELTPCLNQKMANISLDDDTREEELSQIAYDEILDNLEDIFITYKTNDNNKAYYIDMNDLEDIFITYKTNDNNKAYYIDMNDLEDYAPDISDIVNLYCKDLEEDYWE